MTITFLAPDGVAVTAQQERQARAAQHGGGAGRPLGGRSGFRVDTGAVLTATSTTWTLTPCSAMIDPGASTHQGMYGWSTDANVTGAVTAADATNPRKDIVYIQVNDSSAGDGSGALSAPVLYLAGTPAVSPVAPTLPARSFLVGTITVPAAGGGAPSVVLNTARYASAGAPLPVGSLAERDALVKHDGLTVRRMDLPARILETWDGAAWLATPVMTGRYAPLEISAGAFGTTGDVIVEQMGTRKKVTVNVRVNRVSATALAVGTTFIDLGAALPVEARGGSTGNELYFPVSVVGGVGPVNVVAQASVHPVTGKFYIQGTSSFSWTNGALATFNCTYML